MCDSSSDSEPLDPELVEIESQSQLQSQSQLNTDDDDCSIDCSTTPLISPSLTANTASNTRDKPGHALWLFTMFVGVCAAWVLAAQRLRQ